MTELVILVHGIRDFALWQSTIRAALESEGFKTESTNYGRFNLLQFIVPIPYFRRRAINTVWNQFRIIKQNNDDVLLSIIAHSFGTYVISHLMQENFDIQFHRVIFCGSVVRYAFPFEGFQNRFAAPIINEVGTRDVWPAIAESATWGYGSAGTYGFRRPLVRDRWHNGARHGFFLNADFCKRFWIPFLKTGAIVDGDTSPESPRGWLQLLSILKIKYVLIGLLIVLSLYLAKHSFDTFLRPEQALLEEGISYSEKGQADEAIAMFTKAISLDREDSFAWYDRCDAYLLKQDWNRALVDCSEAIRLNPTIATAWADRCSIYAEMGYPDRALEDCSESIGLDATRAVTFYFRARAYFKNHDYNKAISDLDEAIRLNPKQAVALSFRGYLKRLKGDVSGAESDINTAMGIDPNVYIFK